MAFTHLHVHSEYSLLDGACRIIDLVSKSKKLGQTSVAITDHGVMYGAISFYKEAVNAGVKPIIGCEVYVAARTRFDKEYDLDSTRHHLVLLCKNETGYKNLCQIVSASFTEGYYIKPRADMQLLREYSDGLIALSACTSGEIPRLLLAGRYGDARQKALELRDIYGEDSFYLELQDHGFENQPAVNKGVIKLHNETGIPLVVTNDVHYIDRNAAYVQDVLMCIQTGKSVSDRDRLRFESQELYLKSEEEMRALFPEYPEACDNTEKIASMCNLTFDFNSHHLPEFPLPEGEDDPCAFLKKKCLEGFGKLYPSDSGEVQKRLFYELDMIAQMGFTDYFLIVADFIEYAKSRGIPVGPGRGSAAGSVASYCLGITTVDPIQYGLYFERFLNPERVSMPDIDIDFCERRRGEVIEYVKQKYGADRVAQIVTFTTLKAKNSVRSVSKALDLTFAEENELAKEIPNILGIKLKDALNSSKKLRTMYDTDDRINRVIDTAIALEDMPKDSSTHAAGVVITKNPVREYMPLTLSKKDDSIATQYTMTFIEELGLLKMDFLSLRNLTVINDAVMEIRKTEPEFSIENIPYDDKPTYDMLTEGNTLGVFQLESTGMTGVCTGLSPKSIEDITAIIALYRPGPMDSIPRFLENNRNREKIRYKHPLLESILSVTYGCIVYQEQVIEIFRQMAGFSLGQADMIRRAMSKKKRAEIDREKKAFIHGDPSRGISGAVANGVSVEIAASIYDEISDFANYAFNKSHAVAYAMVSYQTAYLKCRYPLAYMAALMSSVHYFPEKVADYTAECRDMGIKLLPPDVNESGAMFSVSGSNLRYGLAAVKNIGRGFIDSIAEEREKNGFFKSFDEFCIRMYGNDLNRRAVESLIKCGCFDSLGAQRSQLMQVYATVLDSIADIKRKNFAGQFDMFGFGENTKSDQKNSKYAVNTVLPNIPEFPKSELMRMEREVTGLYLSGHPIDEFRTALKKSGTFSIGEIIADFNTEEGGAKFKDGQIVTIAGVISAVKTKTTRNNSLMAYVTIEDGSGNIELIAFQRTIDEYGVFITADSTVIVTGKISVRDEKEPQIVTSAIRPINEINSALSENKPKSKTLYVKLSSSDAPVYERIRLVLTMFPGRDQMIIQFRDTRKFYGTTCVIHEALVQELVEMLGEENVVVK